MSATIRVLERDRTFTPLGIRFWDVALDVPMADPLSVFAWRSGGPYAPVRAVRSMSGVYSFHGLPGEAAVEKPAPDEEFPETLGAPREYAIAVDDARGHYLPIAFSVTLPLGYRGEFLGVAATTSPPGAAGRAYLFPGVARPVPPGAAAIRADLVDGLTGEPAAWAVLSVTLAGETRTGIADETGRVMVLLPFPTPERLRLGSPPADSRVATWPVTLSVRWEPAALRYPCPAREGLDPAWATRPSLKSILDEQRPALVWTVEGEDVVDGWSDTLVHGRELVLRTTLAGGDPAATLWISAGTSPP